MIFKKDRSFLFFFSLRRNKTWIILFSLLAIFYVLSLFYFTQTSEAELLLKKKEQELQAKEEELQKKEKELKERERLLRINQVDIEKQGAVKQVFCFIWNSYIFFKKSFKGIFTCLEWI